MSKKKKPAKKSQKHSLQQRVLARLKTLRFPLLLVAIALAPRLLALWGMAGSPLFLHPAIDSQSYQEMAVQIAAGDFRGSTGFWQAPLYPYFLGFIYLVFGVHILIAKLLQVLLGAITCYLVFRLAERIFNRRVAWLAYAVMGLFGPMIFFETQLLAPVLLNLIITATLLVLVSYRTAPSRGKLSTAGFLLGLATIGHGLMLAFLPAMIFWLFMIARRAKARLAAWTRASLLLVIAFLPPILATAAHNYAIDRELVLVSSNFGANFYLGNHPNYDSTTAIRPGLEWDEFIQQPVVDGIISPAQRSDYFASKAWSFIFHEPLGFAGLLIKKLHLLTAGEEIKRNLDIYHFRSYSVLLTALIWRFLLFFPTGLLLPFVIGWMLLFILRSFKGQGALQEWLLWLFLCSQVLAILLFFISTRYRLDMLPVAAIVAAAMFWEIVDRVRSGGLSRALPQCALILALLVYCNLPRLEPTARDRAEYLFYEGQGLSQMNLLEPAIEKYREALSLNPEYGMARYNLAKAYMRSGEDSLANGQLDKLVADSPNSFVADLVAGRAYLDHGDTYRAEDLFRAVLKKNPNSAEARVNLGQIYRAAGDTTQALWHLRKALAVDPRSYKAYNLIGAVYLDRKMIAAARENFARAIELDPSYVSALNNMATVAAQLNQMDESERYLKRALRVAPDDVSALLNYAALKLRQNDPQGAMKFLDRAVEVAPDFAQAHHFRGVGLESLHRTKEAIAEFKQALKLNPNFTPSRQELQRLGR